MNDPANQPIDLLEQKNWVIEHRQATGLSWSEMAKRTGIPSGTLSQFASERGYTGNEQNVAERIFRYRQYLVQQASIEVDPPERPSYFDTETSKSLLTMLTMAQRGGRVVVAAMGPGTGKTEASKHHKACIPNVFWVTMTPSTAGVNNMQIEVLEALGEKDAVGTPQKLSRRIRQRLRDLRNPLLILDEAQHLSEKALEEIRSWNDAEGVGIALFGNESVLMRLEGGNRRLAFAQLFSRISLRLVRSLPLRADVIALAEAWEIHDEAMQKFLVQICTKPGGLRNGTHAIELASMIAQGERQIINVGHLQDAWAQLSSRSVSA